MSLRSAANVRIWLFPDILAADTARPLYPQNRTWQKLLADVRK